MAHFILVTLGLMAGMAVIMAILSRFLGCFMNAFSFSTERLPLVAAVLYVAYLIRENPQEPHEDEPPILPPEDWPEWYVKEIEEELRRERQERKSKRRERRRKP